MKGLINQFASLTTNEILAIKPTIYDDYDLLNVIEHFNEQDDERVYAVVELILRSPDYDEMVDYSELYSDLIEYYHFTENYSAALRWTYARLASTEQHESGADRAECINQLIEAYLCNDDPNTAIKLFIRRIQHAPQDLQPYYAFANALWLIDNNDLALDVIHRGLALASKAGDQDLQESLEQLRQSVKEDEIEASSVQVLDRALIAKLRTALCLETDHPTQETEPYLPPINSLFDQNSLKDPNLRAEILSQMRVFAPELIRLAFDETLPAGPAVEQVVELLCEMQPDMQDEFLEIFPWLNRAAGAWRDELLLPDFGKVGGYSTAELREFGLNLEYAENIRVSAIEALEKRLEKCPEQRPEVVKILRELLTRPELDQASEEFLNGVIIDVILNIDARELTPEIKAVFERDCVDPTMVS